MDSSVGLNLSDERRQCLAEFEWFCRSFNSECAQIGARREATKAGGDTCRDADGFETSEPSTIIRFEAQYLAMSAPFSRIASLRLRWNPSSRQLSPVSHLQASGRTKLPVSIQMQCKHMIGSRLLILADNFNIQTVCEPHRVNFPLHQD
jgi:hypothetical protein